MRLLAPTLAALLASCASTNYTLHSSTAPDATSEVNILGERPKITVQNRGPARLQVTIDAPGDEEDEVIELDLVSFTVRRDGPVLVVLRPLGEERTRWRITAKSADGLRYDLRVAPEED